MTVHTGRARYAYLDYCDYLLLHRRRKRGNMSTIALIADTLAPIFLPSAIFLSLFLSFPPSILLFLSLSFFSLFLSVYFSFSLVDLRSVLANPVPFLPWRDECQVTDRGLMNHSLRINSTRNVCPRFANVSPICPFMYPSVRPFSLLRG